MRLAPFVLLLLLLGAAARAQAPGGTAPAPGGAPVQPAGPPSGAAVPARPALDPAQARQVLDTLRDDRRRAEFLNTLEGIVRAHEAARPAAAGTTAPGTPTGPARPAPAAAAGPGAVPGAAPGPDASPAPTAAVAEAAASPPAGANPAEAASSAGPLAPDSLGAQLLVRVSAAVSAGAAKIAATVHAVNDLPLLWRWISTLVTDPVGRAKLLDAGWKMLACVGIAVLAERAVARLLRRFRDTLARLAPDHSGAGHEAGPGETEEDPLAAAEAGEVEHSRRRHRLTLALRALRRLPYVLGALVLDLLPLVVFAALGNLLLGTALGQPPTTRLLILAVVNAYVLCRVVLAVVRLLTSPDRRSLRLLTVSDAGALFIMRWARRIAITGVGGYALAEVGLLFGLYRAAHDSLLKLVALAVHACVIAMVLQARGAVSRRLRAPVPSTGAVAALRNRVAEVWHVPTVLLIAALWLVWAVELRDGYARLLHFVLVTGAVLVAARLVSIVALGALDRLFRIGAPAAAARTGMEARLGFYYPAVRLAASVALWALTGLALAQAWGLPVLFFLTQDWLGRRTASALLLIGLTVLLAVLAWEGANAGIERYLAKLSADAQAMRAARLRTLLPMMRSALLATILAVVALTVLSELGVNIAPLLAGAGVVGIAVGFGSQKLVQDLITGLFLLLENAMQVGDVVTLGGLSGTVEALSVRTIRLRALDGSIHIIPFSAVTTVTNQTRDYAYAVLDVNVGFDEEPDRVAEVLRDVAAGMAREERWAPLLAGELEVMGVDRFLDTAWVMRSRIKTLPGSRMPVLRELNRRVKIRFDELAIESPLTSHKVLGRPPPSPPAPPKPLEEPAAAHA